MLYSDQHPRIFKNEMYIMLWKCFLIIVVDCYKSQQTVVARPLGTSGERDAQRFQLMHQIHKLQSVKVLLDYNSCLQTFHYSFVLTFP